VTDPVRAVTRTLGLMCFIFGRQTSEDAARGVGGSSPQTWLAPAFPSPAREGAGWQFSVQRVANYRLAVYDLSGRLIRTLVDGQLGPGVHTAAWDGRDGAGRAVASGIYLCRMTGPGVALRSRSVIVR